MAIKFLNTVAVDTDVLYVDTSSNNVGIGTTSPGVKLHVDSSSYGEIAKFGNGNVQLSFGMESTHGYINAQIQGTTFRNLSLNPGGGNVGIGTTVPSQKLDVVGSAQITNDIYLGRYIFHDGDTDTWFGFPLADTISFRTNNSDRMYITSAGNVGIGTTSPASKLTIGDISLGATGGLKIEDPSNTAYGAHYSFDDASSTVEIGGVTNNTLNDCISIARDTGRTITIDTNAKVGIGTTSPTSKLHVAQDQNNTFSTAIAWTASANDVLNITNNNSTDTNNYASLYMRADGSSGSFSSRIVARNTTAGTGELHFQLRDSAHTANTQTKMMVDSGGNVGIGTTSPSEKLFVNGGNAKIESTGTTYLKLNSNSSFPSVQIQAERQGGTSPPMGQLRWDSNPGATGMQLNYWNFYTQNSLKLDGSNFIVINNGSERMRIISNGNVGIGTTSPSEKLHVYNGKAYVTPIAYAANQSAYALKVGAYNSTSFDMGLQAKSTSGGSPYMSFRTTSVDDTLTIWGGSVGVGGIGIPSYTLDVNGVIRGEQYLRLADTGGTNRFSIRAESTYGTIDNGSNTLNYNANNHLFLVGLSEKMRINSAGNVGIGTTTPLYLLDAAGTIRCTSLIQTSQSDKKENIGDIDKSKPKAIPFKEYRYKSDIDSTGRKRYGVLAEDIENDYPELVYVDSNGDKAVNYIDLLVKRVAELEKELEDISLTPGPKGDKGDTGAQGPAGANGTNGKDGANGNDHLKNVKSITFNEKTGQLEITIEGYKSPFKFNPAK